jgi:transglutaminase-like putative cysteine protease
MIGLIHGAGWWFAMVGTGFVVLAAAAVMRVLGAPAWLASALSSLVLLFVLSASFGQGTTLLGIVPTPNTFARFAQLLAQSKLSIDSQATPAMPLTEFFFLVALGAGVFAIVIDLLAIGVRLPALTAVPLAVILIVPSILLTEGISPLALVAGGLAYVFLLRQDVITRRPGADQTVASLAIASSATVVALLIATTAPGFAQVGRQGIAPSGISIGSGVNPLIDLGKDLRRPAAVPVLQYTTTAKTPPYLRLTTLDGFAGTVWTHRQGPIQPLSTGGFIPTVEGLSASVKTAKIETDVQVQNMDSEWLPVPYPTTRISELNGRWAWDTQDRTVSGLGANANGQKYSATGLELEPTPRQLADAGATVPAEVQEDLDLPSNPPAIIAETAAKVTADAKNQYEQAVDLQDYFRNDGFTYSTDTPVKGRYDNDSMEAVAAFLTAKSGYCVHFATAMAVMARTLGIPARVAIGYLPGTAGAADREGRKTYTVTSDDLHAWPELYFSGVGWVPFEPTVSRGLVPSYSEPASAASDTPSPSAAPTTDSVPSSSASAGAAHREQGPTQGGSTSEATPILGTVLVIVALLVLLAVPAVLRRRTRVRRARRLRSGRAGPALAWDEIVDTCRDLGFLVYASETPRSLGTRIAATLPPAAAAALFEVLGGTERERYGPVRERPDASAAADDLAIVLRALLSEAGALARAKALVAPASLLPMPHGPTRPGPQAAPHGLGA